MRTTIAIDNSLMRQAMKATGLSTKKAVVEEYASEADIRGMRQ